MTYGVAKNNIGGSVSSGISISKSAKIKAASSAWQQRVSAWRWRSAQRMAW